MGGWRERLRWCWRRWRFRTDCGRRPGPVLAASKPPPPDEIPPLVEIEIGPSIDLHTFAPADVRDVVEAYLEEAAARRLREVRIVHGRGRGVQRRIVRSLLARHPLVEAFGDAEPARGGWGATIAWLRLTGPEGTDRE